MVVDFTATWCGPCKMIAPLYDQMADEHKDVVCLKVFEHECGDLVQARGVRGFPTFHFIINGKTVHELVGMNPDALRAGIIKYKAEAQPSFSGAGRSLGGGGPSASADEIRLMRLARMGASTTATTTAPASGSSSSSSSGAAASTATSPSSAPAIVPAAAAAPKLVRFVPNADFLEQLTTMGFSAAKGAKALKETKNSGIEAALEWLDAHENDADDGDDDMMVVDTASAAAPANPESPSESNMTAEEVAAVAEAEAAGLDGAGSAARKMSVDEVKVFLARRRAEKAEIAKEEARQREIRRRDDGRKATEMQEEIQKMQRIRDAQKAKMEAEATRKEKQRLQVELLKDKAERYSKRGEGVPADLQAQINAAVAAYNGLAVDPSTVVARPADPRAVFRASLVALSAFKMNGAGLRAAQTLRVLVRNPLEKPDDAKFRSINTTNPAIKERVLDLTGGVKFLKCAGFVKNEETQTLELSDANRDESVLRMAIEEIDKAIAENIYA